VLRHDISQGSVATHLRCGGISSDDIIANFLLILTVNKFKNRLIFDKVIKHTKIVPFLGHPVYIHIDIDRSKHSAPPQIQYCSSCCRANRGEKREMLEPIDRQRDRQLGRDGEDDSSTQQSTHYR